jgi:acyl-CoA synthetase (AMP-forming)/AMP-acid ligase II
MVPRTVIPVREIPLLGTGKVDYAAARDTAAQSMATRRLENEAAQG